MLSMALIGSHQERYYTSLAAEDYYQDGGEPPGSWVGGGAERLGLTGQVENKDLRSLMQGYGPEGGSLVRNAGRPSRRVGFDLTFNAAKSVSVLFALADAPIRDAVRDAHAAAVRAALVYLEDAAGSVRRGVDGVDSERAGLVVATYEHSTARLVPGADVPDPHLHTHCVVMNVGVTPDGRSATLDSTLLFKHKMAAGALYRAELIRQLVERLGLEVERRGRYAALAAIPESICKHFSKRREAIESHLLTNGQDGTAAASAQAALMTRTTKPRVDREHFAEVWKREGRELGVDAETLLELKTHPATRTLPGYMEQVITRAVERITESQSHFSKRELVRTVAEEVEPDGIGAETILEHVDAGLRSEKIVAVGTVGREERFTTPAMLALEARLLTNAAKLSERSARLGRRTIDAVLAARPTITAEQRAALFHVTHGAALSLVRGLAGTGKTYLLDAARRAFEREGFRVLGCALAANAAKRLEEGSGIKSTTLHRVLFDLEAGRLKLDPRTVVVLDEAAMVGTRLMEQLVAHVTSAGGRIVLVGDDRQLQAIDAGAPFATLTRRFGAAELVNIQRQHDEWARTAVAEFSRGDARAALGRFIDEGLVVRAATRAGAIERLVEDFLQSAADGGLAETLVLAGTRAEAAALNKAIQERRVRAGELASKVSLGDEGYFVGDRVIFRRNAKRLAVLNGERGVVVGANEHGLTVRLDDGRRVTVHESAANEAGLALGYAATTHSSQGATVDRCFVLVGGVMQDREATYVQASRARVATRFYVDECTAGEELDALVRSMERSRAKDLAHDVLAAQTNDPGGEGQELSFAA